MGTQINLPYSYGSASNYKTFQTNGGYNVRAFWTAEEVSHTNENATVLFTLNMYYSSTTALWTNQSSLQFSVEALDPDTGESLAHSGNINMPNLPASSKYTTYQATLVIPRRADGTIKFKPKFWCTYTTTSYLPKQSSFGSALTWVNDYLAGTTVLPTTTPTVYLGGSKVKEIYVGSAKIKEIYKGSTKVL